MRRPLLTGMSMVGLFILYDILNRLPDHVVSLMRDYHMDKLFHIVGGYLLIGVGIAFFSLRNTGSLFLFTLTIGAGWEVFQYLARQNGIVIHQDSKIFGLFEPYVDIVVDMLGAGLYWFLHLRKIGGRLHETAA